MNWVCPSLARPGAAHLLRRQKPPLDDHQRVDQFRAVKIAAPAVVGERRERAEGRIAAEARPEVGLEAPDRDQHRPGHAVALLDALERLGIGDKHRLRPLDPSRRDMPRGEGSRNRLAAPLARGHATAPRGRTWRSRAPDRRHRAKRRR